MELGPMIERATGEISKRARARMLETPSEPLFYADWVQAVFLHFELDAETLQCAVPFELDLLDGRAFVSLVAFTMRDMRPRNGGIFGKMLFKPIATHEFLNVRAYVNHEGITGIYFLAEWLTNRLSAKLGPPLFGLPYRLGRIHYEHDHIAGDLHGVVTTPDDSARLEYKAEIPTGATFQPCEKNSLEEFLMERYTAFTKLDSRARSFHIWHPAWPQAPVDIRLLDTSLLTNAWPWFAEAKFIGANFSPGFNKVWMGRPHTTVTSP